MIDMNKGRRWILRYFSTFRSKLTWAFIFTAMIPLLSAIIIALVIINDYLRNDYMNNLDSNSKLKTQQIEAKLEQIISMQDSLSSTFSRALSFDSQKKDISSSSLSQFEVLRATVTSLEYVYDVKKIRIYSDMLPFTTGDSFHFFPLEDIDSLLRDIALKTSGVNRLDYLYTPADAILSADEVYIDESPSILSFYKVIKNIKGEIIAVYFIDVDVENMMDQILFSSENTVSLSVKDGEKILYSSVHAEKDVPALDDALFHIAYSASDSRYQTRTKSSFTDWIYEFELPGKELVNVNKALLLGEFLVFVFTVALCVTAVIIFPNAFSKRINYFSHAINDIQEEELTSSMDTGEILDDLIQDMDYRDEIDDIIISFSNLLKKNAQLNHRIQAHELEIEKSKLTILQEQISPHFLYNSLDTIRICMLMDKKETAGRLIQSLSQFYRISLSKGQDIICIRDELEMISSYLQIEYEGYDGRIKWDICCKPHIAECGIPKFTLQPIVENSIVHEDFSEPDFDLSIQIRVTCGDRIYIRISDNGPGIPLQKMKQINETLALANLVPTGNYGLQNCCQRIRLHYGEDYGIELLEASLGACVQITLPEIFFE